MKTEDMDGGSERNRPTFGARRPGSGGSGPKISGKQIVGIGLILLLLIFGVAIVSTGNLGITNINDQEVAVKVNYMSGNHEVINTPGYKMYIPFVEKIFPIDKSPQKFLMEGNRTQSFNHTPYLTVRASDGSSFWFESLEIQYSVMTSAAATLLNDSGSGDAFKRDWVRAYARSVLRDEFGRLSAVEAADPSARISSARACVNRLNELLELHGIQVREIVTPKARFDPDYEQAIDDRKTADQKVEKLRQTEEKLVQERGRRLAGVEKDKEIEKAALMGDMTKNRLEAERHQIEIQKAADAFKLEREGNGRAEMERDLARADGLTAKYTKEAEGIEARAEALERRGEVLVREAIIDKLRRIHFTLIPYSRDPAPKRLEHSGLTSGEVRIDPSTVGGN